MELILESESTDDAKFQVSADLLSRYAEWRFTLDELVEGTITADELETAPSIGLNKPDGIYLFTFDGGNIYVELEDTQVRSMSGYAIEELTLFHKITAEHGDAIKHIFELQQSGLAAQSRNVSTGGTDSGEQPES